MTAQSERKIALFIDFENLVTNTGISPSSFDLQPALDRLLEKGKVIFRRAYCDWSRFKEAKARLHELGVELIDVPPSTRAGKNAADMRLVIDALELCYAREHIDTYVIASGDSDFVPLASKLRENDRFVVGLAVKEATSPMFVKACDEFLYLRGSDDRRDRPPTRSDRERVGRGGGEKDKDKEREKDKKPRAVPAIAREVVANLLARATGPLNPSFLKEAIVRKEPDFDERDHGFSTFSRMLEAMEKDGQLRRVQQGRQWYVVSADSPADARPDSPQDARPTPHDAAQSDLPLSDAPQSDEEEAIPDPD